MVYQRMLFGMGVLPKQLDDEEAEVMFDVLKAKSSEEVCFIDEL